MRKTRKDTKPAAPTAEEQKVVTKDAEDKGAAVGTAADGIKTPVDGEGEGAGTPTNTDGQSDGTDDDNGVIVTGDEVSGDEDTGDATVADTDDQAAVDFVDEGEVMAEEGPVLWETHFEDITGFPGSSVALEELVRECGKGVTAVPARQISHQAYLFRLSRDIFKLAPDTFEDAFKDLLDFYRSPQGRWLSGPAAFRNMDIIRLRPADLELYGYLNRVFDVAAKEGVSAVKLACDIPKIADMMPEESRELFAAAFSK